ncbi:UNVERIFIED_CONTAM: hypothetical protein Sangu_0432900 [Sesamum angustifolium]|uniref:Uncharacterized protein n=1 Tax=Sesamum angustifolium TaxID=2727405 RepID=A0AAW2QTY0_9LAMI
MEFDDDNESGLGPVLPPALVSLTPFTPSVSPSPRRLSSYFTQPSKPVRAKRQLAWVSLQGRLVAAEEASTAKTVDRNGAFTAKEAVAWELFTPIQRDQVLLSMQQKLDGLCEQVNYFKDQPEVVTQIAECGCKLCQHHNLSSNGSLFNTSTNGLNGDKEFNYKMPQLNEAEPEERRMSDLSDWAPSVTSSVDNQLDSLAIEHDINSLRKECEEKDITIKELCTFLQSSEVLEDCRTGRYYPQEEYDYQQAPKGHDNFGTKVQLVHLLIQITPRIQTQALALKRQEISIQTSDKASKGDLNVARLRLYFHRAELKSTYNKSSERKVTESDT